MIQYMHDTKQCTIMILCRVIPCADPEYSVTLRAGDPPEPKAQYAMVRRPASVYL